MDRGFGCSDVIVDTDSFMKRQIDIAFGNQVDEPILKFDDRTDIEKRLTE